MREPQRAFPTRSELWWGAVIHTVAHAVFLAPDPSLANEVSWDGINYNRQDSQGACGTVTFAADGLVGVYFDAHSARSPYRRARAYTVDPYFVGIPAPLLGLAHDEALRYVLADYYGRIVPVITAACWATGEGVTAVEPRADVLAHGAHLLWIESMETALALVALHEEYEFSGERVRSVRSVYERRRAVEGTILLTPEEHAALVSEGDAGLDESRTLLASVGVSIPPGM